MLGALVCAEHSLTHSDQDLAARLGVADVRHETAFIDLGEPGTRAFLDGGWSADERDGYGSFVWATGGPSALHLELFEPRDLTLVLRCKALNFAQAPQQQIEVSVNGRPEKPIAIGTAYEEIRVNVPASSWIAGRNRVEFRYRHARRPVDVIPNATDDRALAVAWDWIRVEGVPEPREPSVEFSAHAATLQIPGGTRVDYYAQMFPGAALELAGLSRWGEGHGIPELHVELEMDGSDERRTFVVPPSAPDSIARRVALPVASERLARISLIVTPGTAAATQQVGLGLLRPILRQPRFAPRHVALRSQVKPQRPNIIVYLIDTLRADHLGCYGYQTPVSPRIDAFAAEATLFEAAYAQASWTRASVASIFTGLLPESHGVTQREDGLALDAVTLAERLEATGYETAALVTNGNVAAPFGMAQGFQLYDYRQEESDVLNGRAHAWLARAKRDRPFFLYLHTLDPHAPYTPHSPFLERFAPKVTSPHFADMALIEKLHGGQLEPELHRRDLTALYDQEIAFNDANFGTFLDSLRKLDLYDSALIVLIADHGEEFYEHQGWEHGRTLYAEQLHVPLIVKWPAGMGAGKRVAAPVQLVDLVPTILSQLGEKVPAELAGRSLLPLLRSPATARDSRIPIAHLSLEGRNLRSIVVDQMKLIEDAKDSRASKLFDLRADPAELEDLSARRPIWVGYLRTLLADARASAPSRYEPTKPELERELESNLRALGYID